MTKGEEFESIDALRAHYYPDGARLLAVESDELLEFPRRMSEAALEEIRRIAERAVKEAQESHDVERSGRARASDSNARPTAKKSNSRGR